MKRLLPLIFLLIFLFGCGASHVNTGSAPITAEDVEVETLRENVKVDGPMLPGFTKVYNFAAGGEDMLRTNEVWKDEQGRTLIFDYILYDNEQNAENSFTLTKSKLTFPKKSLSIGEAGWEARQGDRTKICFLRSRAMVIISFPDRETLLSVADKTCEKIDGAAKRGEL